MLIATRCKKGMNPDCPEWNVWNRDPGNEDARADEFNKLCGDCDAFDAEFEKPDKLIAHACDVANSSRCLHEAEVSRLYYRDLSQVESLDELCRPCRKFHPPPS